MDEQEKLKNESIAIIRVEQLYPLPKKQIKALVSKYKNAKTHLWVQEEPYNMGAWPFIHLELDEVPLKVIARPASGSPATGSSKFHHIRQRKIIEKTFLECVCPNLDKECQMVCIGNRWKSFVEEVESHNGETIDSKSISANHKLK